MNPVSAYIDALKKSYIDALKKSFDYHGRTSREEYEMFLAAVGNIIVIVCLGSFLISIISDAMNGNTQNHLYRESDFSWWLKAFLMLISFLFILILPVFGAMARRLNDIGWPFWLAFSFLIFPGVGWLFVIVLVWIPGKKQIK